MKNRWLASTAAMLVLLLTVYQEGKAQTDVMIAVDLSGTMKTNDPSGYRFVGADQFLSLFSLYGRNRGGAIAFGDDAKEIMKLDYVSFDRAGKYQDMFATYKAHEEDWTELGKGLQLCLSSLGSATGRNRGVILISDGIIEGNPHTRSMGAEDAKRAAEDEVWNQIVPALRKAEIRVYTMGLVRNDTRGEATLIRIAKETGGFYTKVEKVEEFYRIYKKMLDDIDRPAGVAQLLPGTSSFPLTSADDGIVIVGPTGYVVIGPNGVAYSTDKQTNSPVKNIPHQYSDGNAILFLSRPEDMQRDGQYWTGNWQVIELKKNGEVTYLSPVNLAQGIEIPRRSAFFKNEYIPIEFKLALRKGFDAEEFLSKCKGTYTAASFGSGPARSIFGDLTRHGTVFRGEALVENEGDYMLQVDLVCENTTYRNPRQRIRVSDVELVDVNFVYDGLPTIAKPFRIEAKQNPNAFTNELAELRGLTNGVINLNLTYGSSDSTPLPQVSGGNALVYTVSKNANGNPLKFEQTGTVAVEGSLSGNLVLQTQDAGGAALSPVPVRVRVRRAIDVKDDWLAKLISYLPYAVSILIAILGAFEAWLQWKYRRLNQMILIGVDGTNYLGNLGDEKNATKRIRGFFKPNAVEDIGGPASDASTKLNAGGEEKFVEIGLSDWSNQHYIRRTGDRNVYLRSEANPLERDVEYPLNPGDDIIIEGIGKFRFQEELG